MTDAPAALRRSHTRLFDEDTPPPWPPSLRNLELACCCAAFVAVVWLACQPDMENDAPLAGAVLGDWVDGPSPSQNWGGKSPEPGADAGALPVVPEASAQGLNFLKLKATMRNVRFWDSEGKRAKAPASLRGRKVLVAVQPRQLWVMNQQCGLVLELRDCKLDEETEDACPLQEKGESPPGPPPQKPAERPLDSLIGGPQPKSTAAGRRTTCDSLIGGPPKTFPKIFHLSNSFGTVPSPAIFFASAAGLPMTPTLNPVSVGHLLHLRFFGLGPGVQENSREISLANGRAQGFGNVRSRTFAGTAKRFVGVWGGPSNKYSV